MKNKVIISVLCILSLGCTKKSNVNVVLNGPLTDCTANSTCTYSYFDNADFQDWNQPAHGNYRVFWYKSINANVCGAVSEFYFKTPLTDGDFDITSGQIAAGQIIANNFACPCCYIDVLFKPIGGEIKGKRTDATHYLVNASIIFGTSANTPVDTLVVNQYFTRQPLP